MLERAKSIETDFSQDSEYKRNKNFRHIERNKVELILTEDMAKNQIESGRTTRMLADYNTT